MSALATCTTCKRAPATERVRSRTVDVGPYSVAVDEGYLHCDGCGTQTQTCEQLKALDQAVIEARRRHEHLLSAADIRRIRQRIGLSQAHLEAALGIGIKTIIRWENSLGIQSKAIDDVLRLIEFDPDNLKLLVRLRQAERADVLEAKIEARVQAEDGAESGALRAAISAALESMQSGAADVADQCEAIVSAIRAHRTGRIGRLIAGSPAGS